MKGRGHMRAVLTRVHSASVTIDGEVVGKIGKGFLILLGVGPNDTEKECRYLAEKALGLRIFEDENEKMNLGLDAVDGQVLVVSQFTLYGNCRKGRRPSFTDAAGSGSCFMDDVTVGLIDAQGQTGGVQHIDYLRGSFIN